MDSQPMRGVAYQIQDELREIIGKLSVLTVVLTIRTRLL
jgi:hypothetical protein